MNGFGKHIKQLLATHDCVIIPGLGGFLIRHLPARYMEEEQMFLPPLRTATFNPCLTLDDGLLAQEYMRCGDLTYPEAVLTVRRETDKLRQALAVEGKAEIDGVGQLTQDIYGQLSFEMLSKAESIESPDSYGLGKTVLSPLHTSTVPKEVDITIPQPRETPIPFYNKKGLSIHLSTSTLNKIAGMVIVFLLVFLFSTPFGSLTKEHQAAILPASLELSPTAASPTQAVEKKETPVIHKGSIVSPQPLVQDNKETYCLVLASGVTQANAEAFVQHLKEQHIKADIYKKGKMRRVVYASYPSKEEAQRELNRWKEKDSAFSNAWVMKK